MTPALWKAVREALGLPGKARITEIPGHVLTAAMTIKKARAANAGRKERTNA